MVALVGAGPDRLFVGEILTAAEIIEIAHRRVLVGTIEQHAADDLDRRFQRDRIGGKTTSRMHRPHQNLLVPHQSPTYAIARKAPSRAGYPQQTGDGPFL